MRFALITLTLTLLVSGTLSGQSENDFSESLKALKESFISRNLDPVREHLSSELKLGPMPATATWQILTQVFTNFPELKKLELVSTAEDHVRVLLAFAGIAENESSIYFDKDGKINKIEFLDNVINEELAAQQREAKSVKQPNPGDLAKKFPSQDITFKAPDGLTITGQLYEIDKTSPVILLCHQAGFNKFEYADIAPRLNKMGYNCLAIDQRSGGDFAGKSNTTAKAAQAKGQRPTFVDAEQDIQSAIGFLAERYGRKIILWGSSYSSGLALFQAKRNDQLKAVLSFSPGDYYGAEKVSLSEVVPQIEIPFFITSSRQEGSGLKELLKNVNWGYDKIHFIPESEGFHGSRALWVGQDGAEEYWIAVKDFLAKIAQ